MKSISKPGILLVANWDSNVGYAWWLMESFWATIANNFTDYQCHLAYPSISKIPEVISNAAITTHHLDFRDLSSKSVNEQLRFLKRNNIKVIYYSDKPSWAPRYWLYRLAGVRRIIVHDHTPGLRSPATGLKKMFKAFIHRVPGLAADGMIATTEFVRQRHIHVNCIAPHKCYVATNGIPELTDNTVADPYALYGIPASRKILVMTGRANQYKGIGFILDCIANLINSGKTPELHFLFLGDGPDLEHFREQAKTLNIVNHVSFPGRVNNVAQLLPACSAAAHPSRGEVGYSLSILEYMRAGLPVIVPDNPSVCGATIHKKTGLIYTEDSEESCSDAILEIISHEKSMGQAATQHQQKYFNLKSCHQQLTAALKTALFK